MNDTKGLDIPRIKMMATLTGALAGLPPEQFDNLRAVADPAVDELLLGSGEDPEKLLLAFCQDLLIGFATGAADGSGSEGGRVATTLLCVMAVGLAERIEERER